MYQPILINDIKNQVLKASVFYQLRLLWKFDSSVVSLISGKPIYPLTVLDEVSLQGTDLNDVTAQSSPQKLLLQAAKLGKPGKFNIYHVVA